MKTSNLKSILWQILVPSYLQILQEFKHGFLHVLTAIARFGADLKVNNISFLTFQNITILFNHNMKDNSI